MVCAQGKIGSIARPVFIVGIYVVPTMRVSAMDELNLMLADIILQAKANSPDVIVVVAGDLNRRSLADGLADFDDIEEVDHGPTRGAEKLDVVFTNIKPEHRSALVRSPLETDNGQYSDHMSVSVELLVDKPRLFTRITKKVRSRREEGNVKFGELLNNED